MVVNSTLIPETEEPDEGVKMVNTPLHGVCAVSYTHLIHCSNRLRRIDITGSFCQVIIKKSAVILQNKRKTGVAVPFPGLWGEPPSGIHKKRIGERGLFLNKFTYGKKFVPAPGIVYTGGNADSKTVKQFLVIKNT